MPQIFEPGDFLVFQLEAAYGLLRVLAMVNDGDIITWHLAAYEDLFLDIDSAESAIESGRLKINAPHLALTNRAFESTQVAKIAHSELHQDELRALNEWENSPDREVSDRSVRLLLGLR